MNFRNRQHGFSLIELLISLVIFTVGLLSIAGLQMVAKKSNYESLQRTTASHIAYANRRVLQIATFIDPNI